jgi:SAM-dependent methyltransferase
VVFSILRRAPRLLAPVVRMYGRRLDQCGATAKGVFWRGEEWQELRFERLACIFEPSDAAKGGITINDLGCGYGAFFDYLVSQPVMSGSNYYGYDIVQEMIAACRDRITDPRAKFIRKMWATKTADYSFACGTYNMNGNANEDEWRGYVEDSLKQLWGKTNKAMAFNMLRRDSDDQYTGLYYIDTEDMRQFLISNFSENVEVFDETPLPDVTFFVRKS